MSDSGGDSRSPLLPNSVSVVGLKYKDNCASSRHPGNTGDFRVPCWRLGDCRVLSTHMGAIDMDGLPSAAFLLPCAVSAVPSS